MTMRERERESIGTFIQRAVDHGYLRGKVLDYGCGRQPYRGMVELADVEYVPFDRGSFPANVSGEDVGPNFPLRRTYYWDAILMNQVVQYIEDAVELEGRLTNGVADLLASVKLSLKPGGYLVLTYPTNWPEVEPEDRRRFTKTGMETMLTALDFGIVLHECRHTVTVEAETIALGYGVIAKT